MIEGLRQEKDAQALRFFMAGDCGGFAEKKLIFYKITSRLLGKDDGGYSADDQTSLYIG